MRKEEVIKLINEVKLEYFKMLKVAMKEVKKHVQPSPETREKLEELARADQEQNIIITKQGKDIETIRKDVTEIKNEVKDGFDKIEQLIVGCDNKYAAKWAEKILVWGGGIVGGSILVALISLILK